MDSKQSSGSVRETMDWLADLITSDAADKQTGEFVIGLEDGEVALIVPEEQAVYLITVKRAAFVMASNQDSESA